MRLPSIGLGGVPSIKSFINKGSSRSINTKKNIITSLLIRGISILVSLILVPLTIHYVNPTQYGIWLTLGSVIGWLGFFDIGFGNGLRNKFSEALAKGKYKLARIYVSTTYAILIIIICIVFTIFLCINPFLNWSKLLNAPSNIISELNVVALLVFSFFCIQFVLQLLTTIMTANQQPGKASIINFIGTLGSLLFIFILTKTTHGNLINLAIGLSAAPVLVLIISTIWFYTHEYAKYAPSIKFVKFRFAKGLMTLGLKFFIIQIAFLVLYQTDNIVIAQLFGPKEVTPYNIAYKYFAVVPMVFSIILTPFWSAFTEAWFKNDLEWIKRTMTKLKLFWGILIVVAFLMVVASDVVFRFWVGNQIIVAKSISACMALYVVINAYNGIYSHFLNGVGKIKIQLYSAIFGILLNIPLVIILGKLIGIKGVILANAIFGAVNMIWGTIQYNKIINNKATGIWGM